MADCRLKAVHALVLISMGVIQATNDIAYEPAHTKWLHLVPLRTYDPATGQRIYQFNSTEYKDYVVGQPPPGMIDAMKGYHLFEGDPVNENPDLGVRYPLFEIGPKDASGQPTKIYEDAYTVTPKAGCDVSYDAETSWKLYDYLAHTGNSFLAEGSAYNLDKLYKKMPLPFSIHVGGRTSYEKEQLKKLFVEEHGAVTTIHATCYFYQVQIAGLSTTLKFHIGFQNALRDMYFKSNDSGDPPKDGAAMLKKMFDTYGTHYSSNTYLGSKIVAQKRLTGYQRRLLSEDELNFCAHLGVNLPPAENLLALIMRQIHGNINGSFCHNATKVFKEEQTKSVNHWSYRTYGSEKKDTVKEWTHQIVKYPYAVKRVLHPWVHLLESVENLIGIDPSMNNTDRLAWMKEMYYDYCATFNVSCDRRQRCYINDPCSMHDLCSMENERAVCKNCYRHTHNPIPRCEPTGVNDTCFMRLTAVHWREEYISSKPLDRDEAAAMCKKWNGTLPIVNNDIIKDAVMKYLTNINMVSSYTNQSFKLWVDGKQENGIPTEAAWKRTWKFSDGKTIPDVAWMDKEPNKDGACIRFNAVAKSFEDAACNNSAAAGEWHVVCALPHSPHIADKSQCPVKRVMDKFGCYWGHTRDYCFIKLAPIKPTINAYDAYETCWSRGLYLPILRTPEMQVTLLSYMRMEGIEKVWVDGHPNSEPNKESNRSCSTNNRDRWFFNNGISETNRMPRKLWCSDSPSQNASNCRGTSVDPYYCPMVTSDTDRQCMVDGDCKELLQHVVCQVSGKVLIQGYEQKDSEWKFA